MFFFLELQDHWVSFITRAKIHCEIFEKSVILSDDLLEAELYSLQKIWETRDSNNWPDYAPEAPWALQYQLCQKNIHKANLRKTFLAQRKVQKALDENKILNLEEELMKIKTCTTASKDSTKLKNEVLKDNLRSSKILHKVQIQMKDARIVEQTLTIKTRELKSMSKNLCWSWNLSSTTFNGNQLPTLPKWYTKGSWLR